jgi:hypothetical protein
MSNIFKSFSRLSTIYHVLSGISLFLLFGSLWFYWYVYTGPAATRELFEELNALKSHVTSNPHLLRTEYESNLHYDLVPPAIFNTNFTYAPLEKPNENLIQEMAFQTDPTNQGSFWPPQISPPIYNLTERIDYPFIFPSEGIPFEEQSFTFNVSPQALPVNPSGYRYFGVRRIETYLPYWQRDTIPTWRSKSQVMASCFSDWFPLELIRDQEAQHLSWLRNQTTYYDPYHIKTDLEFANEEREKFKRYYIDMDKIDKDKLANYYGYRSYNDMPYHPRVPLSNTNSVVKWVHRCVTPWQFDNEFTTTHNYHYYSHFGDDRPASILGSEDFRIWYDRCGRLKLVYSSLNSRGPTHPDLGVSIVDGRRADNRLQISMLDLCPSNEYVYPQSTLNIDGARMGHSSPWQKNHLELAYGFGEADIGQMTQWINDVGNFSTKFDPKTNSHIFSPSDYKKLTDYRLDFYLERVSPQEWKSIVQNLTRKLIKLKITQTPTNFEQLTLLEQTTSQPHPVPKKLTTDNNNNNNKSSQFSKFQDIEQYKAWKSLEKQRILLLEEIRSVKQLLLKNANYYFHQQHTYLIHSFPMMVRNGTLHLDEAPKIAIQSCLLDFGRTHPPEEFNARIFADNFHSATQVYLIRLTDADYNNQKINIPKEKRSEWVYWAIGHDRSKYNPSDRESPNGRRRTLYRPLVFMMDAITLELIAVLPFQPTTDAKCRKQPKHCYTGGIGPDCERYCHFTYIHAILPVQTPLSFTITQDEKIIDPSENQNVPNEETVAKITQNYNVVRDIYSAGSHASQIRHSQTPPGVPLSYPDDNITQRHGLHTVLPTWYTLDTQWFISVNINDESTILQELDLRALWFHRHVCPNEQREQSGYTHWKQYDWDRIDPVELKFAFQQRPQFLLPSFPDWVIPPTIRRFYGWDHREVVLFWAGFAICCAVGVFVLWFCFVFKIVNRRSKNYTVLSSSMEDGSEIEDFIEN